MFAQHFPVDLCVRLSNVHAAAAAAAAVRLVGGPKEEDSSAVPPLGFIKEVLLLQNLPFPLSLCPLALVPLTCLPIPPLN